MGETCVVMGPFTLSRALTESRRQDDERTFHVESSLIFPTAGCPVICHGLVDAPHLNGKLGEVRDICNISTGL